MRAPVTEERVPVVNALPMGRCRPCEGPPGSQWGTQNFEPPTPSSADLEVRHTGRPQRPQTTGCT